MLMTIGWRVGLRLLTFAVSLLFLPTQASAQGPVQAALPPEQRSFALDYHAHVGCPDALSMVAAIQARSPAATSVARESAAVQLKIELAADGQSRLWVDLPEGSFRRQFLAETCDEAVASIALIASMVLEAEPAQRSAMTELSPLAAPPGQDGGAAPLEPTAAATAPPSALPAPTPPPPVPPSPPPLPPSALSEPSRLRWALVASTALETAVAPTPPFGAMAGLEGRFDRAPRWSPSLRLELMATLTSTVQTPAGDGSFRLLAGRLQGCPLQLTLAKSLRLVPCALVEVGSLQAQGGGAALNVQAPSMLWLAFGGALRAQLDLIPALALEGTLSATALAEHAKFVLLNSSLVYQVPVGSFGAGLGILLRLP
jgi:hypothetical protein